MIQEGLASAMPSASIPGRLYFTSDTQQIFRDNGATWDNVTPTIPASVVTAIQQQAYVYAADTDTANALVVSQTPTPTIAAGSLVVVKVAHTNTGASTIAVNGGSATAITKNGTTALSGGELNAGQIVFLVSDGTEYQLVGGATSGGGSGTVTSVSLTVPSRQSVSGSPVTTSGTLAISDNNQSANQVFAGPSSGSAAAPGFRSLVSADLPLGTTSAAGALKPDGSTIDVSSGTISVPTATTSNLGIVKPDGTTITISGGVISSSGGSGVNYNYSTGNPNTSGGTATPALVQSTQSTSGSSCTFTNPVVSGNLLVVISMWEVGNPTSYSDTVGTTYTNIGGVQTQSFDNGLTLFIGTAAASGSNTISLSGGSALAGAMVAEFSGTITTADVAFATNNGNSSTPTVFNITTSQANDLVVSACVSQAGGPLPAVSTNLTALQSTMNWASGYNVQSSVGAKTYAWSLSSSTKWAEFIIALKANPSGPLPGVDNDQAYDTTTSPWTAYVFHGGMWNQYIEMRRWFRRLFMA